MLIDIHTHQLNADNTAVIVLDPRSIPVNKPPYYCLGIHPWYIHEIDSPAQWLSKLDLTHLYALGEIGLDKAIATNLDQQIECLELQLNFAQKNNLSRIIIHCVHAYNEIYKSIKDSGYKGKILFHDYRSSREMAHQMMRTFDCYFSFGASLFQNQSKYCELIKNLPKERIFLETDDQSKISIEQLYSCASDLLKLSPSQLEQQIFNNFKVFSA